jgi:hypothetical protein
VCDGLRPFSLCRRIGWGRLTEKWKTKDGTGPSKSYGILMKALGVLFGAAGCPLAILGG